MTKKRRARLFYLLLCCFFVLGGIAVFYAQGWRFDTSSLSFGKVGAIYIRTFPDMVNIFLDGRPLAQKPGLFDKGIFINGLFPRVYPLQVSLPGYRSWGVRVRVAPSLVVQLKYLVLVPEQGVVLLPGPLDRLWQKEGILVTRDAAGTLFSKNQKLSGKEIVWFTKGGSGALAYDPARGIYFWNDIEAGTSTSFSSLFRNARGGFRLPARSSLLVSDRENGAILVSTTSSLSLFSVSASEVQQIVSRSTSTIVATAISPRWIVWSSYNAQKNISSISGYDRVTQRTFLDSAALTGKTTVLGISDKDALGAVQHTGELFLGTPGGEMKNLASDVRTFLFSEDGSKIAARETEAIEIFSLAEDDEMYSRFSVPFATEGEKLIWYRDNHHLILSYPDRALFLDFADKELKNLVEIARGKDFSYDPEENVLYYISEGAVFGMEFPH